ncbi:F-box protein SKIP16 [Sesamum angolense]|uniref:F-box protein SKIP16 n=1 Tax=Sesamum angolense TaxID=2727404 RepID=A0AAE1X6L5_9LAMI|nr:F-box protein SKIP16 [Sesamum angolense]
MGLESVGGLAMHTILSKLGPLEAASVSCLSRRFRGWASDDSLWAGFCSHDLNLSSPLDPYGNPLPSFKAAYTAWREEFSMYPWPLVIRVKNCWRKLKEWLAVNLPEVILDTKGIMHQLGFSIRSNGQLFVGTRNLVTDGEMLPCVPDALISSVHDATGIQQQDAMLLWLEEHGRRLQDGIIKVRKEGKIRSINLFPEKPPLCSSAITNGVKVRASAAFVPEFSDLQDESEKFLFAYSIRMSLSPDGCVINGMTFSSCQLYWRHWIIRANDAIVSDVNGEAVIGKFPLLHPGEEEFVYESCTSLPASRGSVEGSFTFVPGRLADAKGSPFSVEVARFPLQLPNYILIKLVLRLN